MRTAAELRAYKAQKVQDLQKVLRDWKPVNPLEEYHTALAGVIEAVDMKVYIDDEIRRIEFDHAMEVAKKLLKSNGW